MKIKMKITKKLISVLAATSILATMLLAPMVSFAANFMDEGWYADFDSNTGNFPNWTKKVQVDDEHQNSLALATDDLNKLSGTKKDTEEKWFNGDNSPFKNKAIDTQDGTYIFSQEFYLGDTKGKYYFYLGEGMQNQTQASTLIASWCYNAEGKTFAVFNEQGNFASTEFSIDLANNEWHKIDFVIDLKAKVQKVSINGEKLGDVNLLQGVIDKINQPGGYTTLNMFTKCIGHTPKNNSALDNMSFTKYSTNEVTAVLDDTNINLTFKNSVDPAKLTTSNIAVKKYTLDDILMQNGTDENITISNALSSGCTIKLSSVSNDSFYGIDLKKITDIAGGKFDESVKVVVTPPEGAQSQTDTVANSNFNDLEDTYTDNTTAPTGYTDGVATNSKGKIKYSKYSYNTTSAEGETVAQTGLKISVNKGDNADWGMYKKIKLANNSGILNISFDYIRPSAFVSGSANHVTFRLFDETTDISKNFFKFEYGGQWPKYYDAYGSLKSIEDSDGILVGEAVPIGISINLATKEVTLTIKNPNLKTFKYTMTENFDFTADDLYFSFGGVHHWTAPTDIVIDNVSITHTYTLGGATETVGGATFFDYSGNQVFVNNGEILPTVNKITLPVSTSITASDIQLLENSSEVEYSTGSYSNGKFTILLDGVLKENKIYTIKVGNFAKNAGEYTFTTKSGLFKVSDLKILKNDGTAAKSIEDCANVKLSSNVVNNKASSNIEYIIAVYKNNTLKDVQKQTVSVASGMCKNAESEVITLNVTDADKITAFAWNSFEICVPLCGSVTIANNQ